MLRLLTLRLSTAVWKRSLSISKKLRVRTWIALAALHACLAIVSFWAYQAKTVPESAIPPVYHAELQPVPIPVFAPLVSFNWEFNPSGVSEGWSTSAPPLLSAGNMIYFSTIGPSLTSSPGGAFHLHFVFQRDPFGPLIPELPNLRPTVVQAPSSPEPSLLTPFEKFLALVSTIITSLLSILNLFLAWQIVRRSKAEAILLRLQIEKLVLENERLREEFDKARGQTEKSGIILLS
jgi:hypothetical protein